MMIRLIGTRLGVSVVLLLAVSGLTFFLQALIPGDAATSILGTSASAEESRQLAARLGLDQPVYERYWHWLHHAITGDLGVSYITDQPVTSTLNVRLPVSLSLVIGATALSLLIGFVAGVVGATQKRLVGRIIDGLSVLGIALPNFWLALILTVLFSSALHWLPTSGYVAFIDSPTGWLRSLVLPVAALSAGAITLVAKQTRDQMLDVLSRPFILSLRANGIPERSIIFRHAARNAAVPVVTVAGLVFVSTLGGTVLIEAVFALPGLGSALVDATSQHDLPMVQGISLYFIVIVIAVNLLIDLVYAWVDPKVRRPA